MTRPKSRAVRLSILAIAVPLIFVHGKTQEQKTQPEARRPLAETRFPIAEYLPIEPTDLTENAKRRARGKKYDNSSWGIHPNAASDTTARIDHVDLTLPALPFEKSSAVVVGQVTDARAFLSNDKTGVYSVFTLQVNEVLKNSPNTSVSAASVIQVEREGGRVRFPNGRLHLYVSHGMPQIGLRYVLFLNQDETGFQVITGYELFEGKVYSLDQLPNPQSYDNSDEPGFLIELRKRRFANPSGKIRN